MAPRHRRGPVRGSTGCGSDHPDRKIGAAGPHGSGIAEFKILRAVESAEEYRHRLAETCQRMFSSGIATAPQNPRRTGGEPSGDPLRSRLEAMKSRPWPYPAQLAT